MSELTQANAIGLETAAALARDMTALAIAAGEAILAVDHRRARTNGKDDGSPVTEADLAADSIIVEGLKRLRPDIPVISEERVAGEVASSEGKELFFIVDPLDGTREFLTGHNDYTVNIALVANGRPLIGIVSAPALGLLWRGIVGRGAERLALASPDRVEPIRTRARPTERWVAAVSRSHLDSRTDAFIRARPGAVRQTIGSALKFCRVAEGSADIYPRLSPISEWDIAAGHAVVEAAGGTVTDSHGTALRFCARPGNYLVPEFIAWGRPDAA